MNRTLLSFRARAAAVLRSIPTGLARAALLLAAAALGVAGLTVLLSVLVWLLAQERLTVYHLVPVVLFIACGAAALVQAYAGARKAGTWSKA